MGVDANGRAAIEWGVTGMPETFIINGKGEIVYKHIGPISEETLERTSFCLRSRRRRAVIERLRRHTLGKADS